MFGKKGQFVDKTTTKKEGKIEKEAIDKSTKHNKQNVLYDKVIIFLNIKKLLQLSHKNRQDEKTMFLGN